jgi:hypothetical protein
LWERVSPAAPFLLGAALSFVALASLAWLLAIDGRKSGSVPQT